MRPRADMDIARNLKAIEWLKTELLGGVCDLFRAMREANDEAIADQLANVTVNAYALARRLGLSHAQLDERVRHCVRSKVESTDESNELHTDYAALSRHFKSGDF